MDTYIFLIYFLILKYRWIFNSRPQAHLELNTKVHRNPYFPSRSIPTYNSLYLWFFFVYYLFLKYYWIFPPWQARNLAQQKATGMNLNPCPVIAWDGRVFFFKRLSIIRGLLELKSHFLSNHVDFRLIPVMYKAKNDMKNPGYNRDYTAFIVRRSDIGREWHNVMNK